MTRMTVTGLLLATLCISALLTVYSVQTSRLTFSQLHGLKQAEGELQREWAQLLVEQGAWDSLSRIERLARKEFALGEPQAEQIALVRLTSSRSIAGQSYSSASAALANGMAVITTGGSSASE